MIRIKKPLVYVLVDIQTLSKKTLAMSSVYQLSPIVKMGLICCLLRFPRAQAGSRCDLVYTLKNASVFCITQLFGVLQPLVRLQADERVLMEDHPAWFDATAQLMPFQCELHGCRPTCRCYVNSSLRLFSCPAISDHVKKK